MSVYSACSRYACGILSRWQKETHSTLIVCMWVGVYGCSLMVRGGLPLQPRLRSCLSVCTWVSLSPRQCGRNRNDRRVGGRAESGEGAERQGGGRAGWRRERNLATICSARTFESGKALPLCLSAQRTHARAHTETHTDSTADDNGYWENLSRAALRITCLFLHGAAHSDRCSCSGRWSSE